MSLFGGSLPIRIGNYVVTVLLLASALALVLTLPPQTFRQAEAQTFSRSIVTVYQTVYVPVYTTIFRTLTYTAYSTSYSLTYSAYTTTYPVTYYSLTTSSVTQLSISLTTVMGILGAMPSTIFRQYSDIALIVGGALGGVAVGLASSSLIGKGMRARAAGEGTTESGAIDIESMAELTMFELWKSGDEELMDALEQMHEMNELKKKMRDLLTKQKELRDKFKDIDFETWSKWRDNRPQYKPPPPSV
jgi:hypothetical protein